MRGYPIHGWRKLFFQKKKMFIKAESLIMGNENMQMKTSKVLSQSALVFLKTTKYIVILFLNVRTF